MSIVVKKNLQKVACIKRQGWVTRAVTYTPIGFNLLCEHIAQDTGISQGVVIGCMHALTQQVKELLINGHTLNVQNLGTLKMNINAHSGGTKKEGGAHMVYRRTIGFTPCKALKDAVNRVEVVTV